MSAKDERTAKPRAVPVAERKSPAQTAHRVDDTVWISGYQIAADPDFVRRAGITHIVKMFADDPSYPGGMHRHPGVRYLVVAADDLPEYDIREGAARAVRFIQEARKRGEKVLVHCHMGISRSSTVVLLHLMVNRGFSLPLALERLRMVRPVVQPNEGFMRHLQATDARLQRLRAEKQKKPPGK